MPATPGRKQATHEKVLKAAARAIRSRGPAGVGVVEIMREAGLTHGGFYAHFASKDDLIAEAVGWMFEETRGRLAKNAAGKTGRAALHAIIDRYVSEAHRDDPGRGCPLPALVSDLPHLGADTREAFAAGVKGMARRMAGYLPEKTREADLLPLIAQAVGAVALARAVGDPALSSQLLKTTRTALKARIDTLSEADA